MGTSPAEVKRKAEAEAKAKAEQEAEAKRKADAEAEANRKAETERQAEAEQKAAADKEADDKARQQEEAAAAAAAQKKKDDEAKAAKASADEAAKAKSDKSEEATPATAAAPAAASSSSLSAKQKRKDMMKRAEEKDTAAGYEDPFQPKQAATAHPATPAAGPQPVKTQAETSGRSVLLSIMHCCTATFLDTNCTASQERCPYIKLSLLRSVTLVRMQCLLPSWIVLTLSVLLKRVYCTLLCIRAAVQWNAASCSPCCWPTVYQDTG